MDTRYHESLTVGEQDALLIATVDAGVDSLAVLCGESLGIGKRIARMKGVRESNEDAEATQSRRWLTYAD